MIQSLLALILGLASLSLNQITLYDNTDYSPYLIWNLAFDPVPPEPKPDDGVKVGDTCPECNGQGWLGDGVIKNPCPHCKGDGKVDEGDPIITGVSSLPEKEDFHKKIPPLDNYVPPPPPTRYELKPFTEYRNVSVRHCNGRRCWYTTEQQAYTVYRRVPVTESKSTDQASDYATPQATVERILRYLNPRKNEIFLDVGSGDGRVVITAAKLYGCRAIGIEQDEARIALAEENAKKAGVSHLVTFIHGDFRSIEWPKADVGYVYLFPEDLSPIRNKLLTLHRFASFSHRVPNLPMYSLFNGEAYYWNIDKVFTYWGNKIKYGRDCNKPNCSMCYKIESDLAEQRMHRYRR